ncbi:D-amino acid dehydrogenase [Bradyrhizobium sp. CCGUVB1N3]|uniref:D-amino acid dehydrogenase n=1 Tax=Bradyrhizobium sp. CCGUVB1N3 TaxID=2949629 RepID=UPI0020B24F54|nr:D-amino acid dehydrogenase [Bradyrhizobium sp. CCGUVB1N3]MCP3473510.1 D-amino acid dehydrogenase [Bradyrhizobium sp. CCGUVB1N3]
MTVSDRCRVAVIGAGITGITTAYTLLKRGCEVTVFDRHPYAAMETSFANGGQLSASNAEVWNSWATVLKGIKWIFTPGAPLLVNPKPSWHKFSWMAQFVVSIPKYEVNTVTTARLAIESRAHLRRMAQEENIDFDCEDRGILHFYHTKAEFAAAAQVTALLAKGGLERRAVTPEEIRSIEPALKGSFYGGFYTESDFTGDIHKFTTGLACACERLGATMNFSAEVLSIALGKGKHLGVNWRSTEAGEGTNACVDEFDRVVVCGGVGSRRLAASLGDRVDVYPVKGYSITVHLPENSDQEAAPWTSLLDDHAKIVTSRLGSTRFRVAGTAEFDGINKDIRAARIEPLIKWCRTHFPGMSTRNAVPWAGLRPMMPDMLPRVMRGRDTRVFYNTGHGHLGWTLSAATANALAALIAPEYQVDV